MVIKNENECQNSKNQEALFEFAGTYGLTDGAKLSEAIQIYSHLASEGHVGAMYELGKIYWKKTSQYAIQKKQYLYLKKHLIKVM